MSLDQELRDMLAERADRCQAPAPDLPALCAGGLRLRRRRRAIVAVATCGALLATITVGLVAGLGHRGTRGATDPVDRPPQRVTSWTGVPFCVTDPDDRDGEVIVGTGAPIKALCRYSPGHDYPPWDATRANWLWHHAGSTILGTLVSGNYRVADGRLTRLGDAPGGDPAMSHDGRYAAWVSKEGCGLTLYVFEVPTGDEIATTDVPASDNLCSGVEGVDDLGRVYLTMADGNGSIHEIQMYDTRTEYWAKIVGISANNGHIPSVTYVSADGIALRTQGSDAPAVTSIEGTVDAEGRFGFRRVVPVGQGLWSPDRSLVVDAEPDGVVVRPADDLNNRVVLDLPLDEPLHEPGDAVFWPTQWESPSSVLVRVPFGETGARFYRCDARSGHCTVMHRTGAMALANNVRKTGG